MANFAEAKTVPQAQWYLMMAPPKGVALELEDGRRGFFKPDGAFYEYPKGPLGHG